ncbi:hypothetical protein T4D_10066 [Trichinella pseudospiralis]|nr:hypothetical protein T4D_10066 [Trichinella pseudospiralis]
MSLWRNRLAHSAVNRKVGGSSPPRDEAFQFRQSYVQKNFGLKINFDVKFDMILSALLELCY